MGRFHLDLKALLTKAPFLHIKVLQCYDLRTYQVANSHLKKLKQVNLAVKVFFCKLRFIIRQIFMVRYEDWYSQISCFLIICLHSNFWTLWACWLRHFSSCALLKEFQTLLNGFHNLSFWNHFDHIVENHQQGLILVRNVRL